MNERDVFIEALQQPSPAERRKFLANACAGNQGMLRAVEALLEAYERAGSFLEAPALARAARMGRPDPAQAPTGASPKRDTLPAGTDPSATLPPGDNPEGLSLDFLAPARQPDELGRLGTFRVLRVLGAGGMGVVFLAEDTPLQRQVALKVMLPGVAARPNARERFLREARATAAIEHEHIVHINQVGEDKGVPFVSMPLLRGESLQERLAREGKLPAGEVLRIGREIAEGLSAAHERGLIHRDVKPGNIWLESKDPPHPPTPSPTRGRGGARVPHPPTPSPTRGRGGVRAGTEATARGSSLAPPSPLVGEGGGGGEGAFRVKILDFGLARAVADTQRLTQPGLLVGTPSCMSPEQAGGRPVDARSDLFSLGTVLYRMATGIEPFDRGDLIATLVAVGAEPVRPPHEIAPAVPPGLSDLIVRLLAKDPDGRPRSAAEVVRALQALEQKTPDSPPSARRRLVLAAGLALACLAAALLVALSAGLFRDRAPETPKDRLTQNRGSDTQLTVPNKNDKPDTGKKDADKKEDLPSNELAVDLGNGITMAFVRIRAGEFRMGSPETDPEAEDNEKPRHLVRITKDFFLGRYPVTQEQYKAVLDKNPSVFSVESGRWKDARLYETNRFPVESVSWDDATVFCQALTARDKQNRRFRLPTEAEWEYSARAGAATRFFFGDKSSDLPKYAWFRQNSGMRIHEVGTREPNAWGLYDMYGNVWQWCSDRLVGRMIGRYPYYADSPREDPRGPAGGNYRIVRGGSWCDLARHCRSAKRFWPAGNNPAGMVSRPTMTDYRVGFRVCLEAPARK